MGARLRNTTALQDYLCTHVVLQSENHTVQNNADDHGDYMITKPNSKELTKHSGSNCSSVTQPLGSIKTRHPDPSIAQQPLGWKTALFT